MCVCVCVCVFSLPHRRPIVPMEFAGNKYFNIKNTIIKYERFLLKVGASACNGTCSMMCSCVRLILFYCILFCSGAWILCPCTAPTQSELDTNQYCI